MVIEPHMDDVIWPVKPHARPLRPSMLVGSIRRVLHDANVHRLSNRYSNRLSCVVVDGARRTFEEDIDRVLVDIKLTKRLQRVVAAALHPAPGPSAPAPRQPYTLYMTPLATAPGGRQ